MVPLTTVPVALPVTGRPAGLVKAVAAGAHGAASMRREPALTGYLRPTAWLTTTGRMTIPMSWLA
jgi:hypothetical protein